MFDERCDDSTLVLKFSHFQIYNSNDFATLLDPSTTDLSTTATILLLFWTIVLQIYYCNDFATFLDTSTQDLLLQRFCYFFGLLYIQIYYCNDFATFLDPSIYVVKLMKY